MLTIYRRHRTKCKSSGRRAKCGCPIWAQGILHGGSIRQSLDLTNWEAAQKRVRDWEIDGIQNSVSLVEAYDRFLAQHTANDSSADTMQKHRKIKKEMVAFLGDVPLKSITVDDVSRFRESWKLAPMTMKNQIEKMRSFFTFCVGREWIKRNPASILKAPKIGEIDCKPYERDEIEKIYKAIDQFPNWGIYGQQTRQRLRAFITVLRWTGMRIGDVCQLEPAKIESGNIRIRTTKNGKNVSIPMHPEIEAALKGMPAGQRFYFWSGEGKLKSGVSAWERTMKRLYKICGFRANCHRWRHNFATELLAKGVPVSEVAAILGNTSRVVEKYYSQWIPHRQAAIDSAVKATWA
jgi:integrase/recombinase XerD